MLLKILLNIIDLWWLTLILSFMFYDSCQSLLPCHGFYFVLMTMTWKLCMYTILKGKNSLKTTNHHPSIQVLTKRNLSIWVETHLLLFQMSKTFIYLITSYFPVVIFEDHCAWIFHWFMFLSIHVFHQSMFFINPYFFSSIHV